MSNPNLSEILAESFWNGWIPSDLSRDFMKAIDLSLLGPKALDEIRYVVENWPQTYLGGRKQGAIYQIEGLRITLEQAHEQAMQVEKPQHEAIAYLLMALQEGLKAMICSCTAVITAMECNDYAIMYCGLRSAEKAAETLKVVYDGTHYSAPDAVM